MYVGFMMGYILVFDEYIFLMLVRLSYPYNSSNISVRSPVQKPLHPYFASLNHHFFAVYLPFHVFFSRSLGDSENTGAERE